MKILTLCSFSVFVDKEIILLYFKNCENKFIKAIEMNLKYVYMIFYLFSDCSFKDWNGEKEQNDPRSPKWGKTYFRKISYKSKNIHKQTYWFAISSGVWSHASMSFS